MLKTPKPDVTITPEIRDLDHIQRWSIVRKIHNQSVASHIYFVMRYAMQIAEVMKVEIRPTFMWEVIIHEDDELHSGDIPQPWKAKKGLHSGPNPNLTETEQWILKTADILESVLFLADELAMGNTTMLAPYQHLRTRLSNHLKDHDHWAVTSLCNQAIKAHIGYTGRVE